MSADTHLLFPEFALHWTRELETSISSLVRLNGGINNRVFRCGENGRHQWVIKGYTPFHSELRDRMQAEVDFLHYAAEVAPGFTPALVYTDWERRCVVLQYLDGEYFPEGITPPQEATKAAAEFFKRLNLDFAAAKRAIKLDAAEGYLSLAEHINNIEERLDRMKSDHLQAQARLDADKLLRVIKSELARITEITSRHISLGNVADTISPEDRYVSPSDFGFHNASFTKTGVCFFDFEFAGWDDPAKAVIDFELQPRIPPCSSFRLIESVKFKDRSVIEARSAILKPILCLKWCCIALNVLNPARFRNMLSINSHMCEQQFVSDRFDIVENYLSSLGRTRN